MIDKSCDNYIVFKRRRDAIADALSVYEYHIVSSGNADFAEVLCISILWHPDIATIVILFQYHGLGQLHLAPHGSLYLNTIENSLANFCASGSSHVPLRRQATA